MKLFPLHLGFVWGSTFYQQISAVKRTISKWTLGYHALSCQNFQGAVTRRHNLIRDAIFAQCSHIDRNAKIIAPSSQTVANSEASGGAAVYTEQRATERTVPGDVMVSLSSTAESTFYDIIMTNCLTDNATHTYAQQLSSPLGLEQLLDAPFQWKLMKHAMSHAQELDSFRSYFRIWERTPSLN